MFFPEGQVPVFVYGQPVNMRLSYDGLYALTRNSMQQDPLSGHLFAFINRRATQIKVLYWDRTGLCVWAKRLEAEKFAWPVDVQGATQTISLQQFEWLLEGFDLWQNQPHKTLHFSSVA